MDPEITKVLVPDHSNLFSWKIPDFMLMSLQEFFESNILQLDPSLMTAHGMTCFERFFKAVNMREHKLVLKRQGGIGFMVDNLELIGLEYLWRVCNHITEILG